MDTKYIEKEYQRKKQWSRINLGIKRFIHKPVLNLVWIPTGAVIALVIYAKNTAMDYLIHNNNDPKAVSFFNCPITIIIVFLIILLIFSVFEIVGELTARKDEKALLIAFGTKLCRFGCPILIDKYRIKGTTVFVREFLSLAIPYKPWLDKQDAIADAMNVRFVDEIKYGGRNNADGNKIIIKTVKGRKAKEQGVLYDDEL